jgi:hypothetical protein
VQVILEHLGWVLTHASEQEVATVTTEETSNNQKTKQTKISYEWLKQVFAEHEPTLLQHPSELLARLTAIYPQVASTYISTPPVVASS